MLDKSWKTYPVNMNLKKNNWSGYINIEVEFRIKMIPISKEGYFTMTKRSTNQTTL